MDSKGFVNFVLKHREKLHLKNITKEEIQLSLNEPHVIVNEEYVLENIQLNEVRINKHFTKIEAVLIKGATIHIKHTFDIPEEYREQIKTIIDKKILHIKRRIKKIEPLWTQDSVFIKGRSILTEPPGWFDKYINAILNRKDQITEFSVSEYHIKMFYKNGKKSRHISLWNQNRDCCWLEEIKVTRAIGNNSVTRTYKGVVSPKTIKRFLEITNPIFKKQLQKKLKKIVI